MKRKITAFILAISIVLTFAGCNSNELGFYNTIRTLFNLQDYTFEGVLKANIRTLVYNNPNPEDPDTSIKDGIDAIKQTCSNSIVYDGVISVLNNKISLNVGTKDNAGTIKNELKLLAIDKTLYISKDAITKYFPEDSYIYETPLNDGTQYAKFTFVELANRYLDMLKESMVSQYNVSPNFNDDTKSVDYLAGYYDGFYSGATDGYVNDTTKPSYSLAGDANVTDPENGKAQYDEAYELAYSQGFDTAKDQKAIDEAAFEKIKVDTLSFANNASVSNLLKSRQSITTKIIDQIINTFCKDLTVDLVKKDGDNKYTISLDTGKIFDILTSITTYFIKNTNNLKPTLTAIVNSFTNEELTNIGITSGAKQNLLDSINAIPTETAQDIDKEVADMKLQMDEMKAQAIHDIQANYSYTLEKTGSISYNTKETLSLKSLFGDNPFTFDGDITNTMSINKASSGNINTTPTLSSNLPSNTSLRLDITDPNAVGAGIVYSTSPSFTNPIKIDATKTSDGSFIVKLSGIAKNTTFYYKTYTIDAGQNLVYSSDIKTFTTVANPDTSDVNLFNLFALLSLSLMVMIAMPLFKKRRQQKLKCN